MQEYSIKELAEFVNAINKNTDAAIDINVTNSGSNVIGALCGGGLTVKITPPARANVCGRANKCKNRKHKK